MTQQPRRLGRGLSSILAPDLTTRQTPPNAGTGLDAQTPQQASTPSQASSIPRILTTGHERIQSIPVDRIRQNPMQPRRTFDEARLSALAESLKLHGALQPIVVRPAEGGYELIAGERRLRAARLAGIATLPAIMRHANEEQLLELAVVENVLREDLDPIEKSRAYQKMHDQFGMTHEQIGERTGSDRTTIANMIRLLSLPDDVRKLISDNILSVGHAKAILGISDATSQSLLADRVVNQGWTVRKLETEVGRLKREKTHPQPIRNPGPARPTVSDMEARLSTRLGTKVRIHEGRRRHTGKLVIEYSSLNEFQRIAELLGLGGAED